MANLLTNDGLIRRIYELTYSPGQRGTPEINPAELAKQLSTDILTISVSLLNLERNNWVGLRKAFSERFKEGNIVSVRITDRGIRYVEDNLF